MVIVSALRQMPRAQARAFLNVYGGWEWLLHANGGTYHANNKGKTIESILDRVYEYVEEKPTTLRHQLAIILEKVAALIRLTL